MSEVPMSTSPPSRLAIANLNRKCHSGLRFLDEVLSCGISQEIALDFLDHQGFRTRIDYSKLQSLSSTLGNDLIQQLEPHHISRSIIPVVMPQHPTLYLSYLAVLKFGGAICPITPDLPTERIRFMVEDVDAKLVLCLPEEFEKLQSLLPFVKVLAVNLQSLLRQASGDVTLHDHDRNPKDIAYVMYTSGSTGKPKGVLVSHKAATQSLLAHDEHLPSFKRFLQFAAPTFDVSIFEIFFPWFRGSTVVGCDRQRMLSGLPDVMNILNVDAIELTPTVARTLLQQRQHAPGLKMMLTIGEMLTAPVIAEFGGSDDKESILFAMYGPTEAAIHCTINPRMGSMSSPRNIGFPLSTVTTFILEHNEVTKQCRVLDFGEEGELAVAGQLAKGYLNRDEQTEAAFIDLPTYGLVYRTGDKAMMLSDGTLHIFGRIADGQVKIRGQRVELGEVEEVASQAVGVDIAIALVLDDNIVLFCSGGPSMLADEIEKKCKNWLPRHMRPSNTILFPGELPRLPSGKIDRQKLKTVYWSQRSDCKISNTTTQSNASTTEDLLCCVIAEELRTEILPHSDLWKCGLDSLRAIRIASRLRSKLPYISVAAILDADAVTDIVFTLMQAQLQGKANANSLEVANNDKTFYEPAHNILSSIQQRLDPSQLQQMFPCSSIQIAMLSQTARNSSCYVNEILLNLSAKISPDTVVDAFRKLAAKNDILRAGFVSTDDPEMPFVQITYSSCTYEQAVSILHPIQLIKQPSSNTIKYLIHHAVYDGWSWDLIMMDLNSILRGEEIPVRPQYHRYVSRGHKYNSSIEEDLTEWTTYLQHEEHVRFPTLLSQPFRASKRSVYTSNLQLSPEQLSTTANHLRVSSPAVVHAALTLLLSNLLDTRNVISGLVLAGRDPIVADVEAIIGPCLATLPVLIRLDGCGSLRDLALTTYRQHIHAMRYSHPSLAQIKTASKRVAGEELFDVIFVWQESPYSGLADSDLIATAETHDYLEYALSVEVEPRKDVLRLKTNYDCALISDKHVVVIHQQLNFLINLIVQHQETAIEQIWQSADSSLLSISNHNYATTKFGNLCSTIARIAFEDPDRLAIDFVLDFNPPNRSFVREKMTYRDLHLQSLAMGTDLCHRRGLSSNDIVAIWCPKSVSTYTLICGIIQAGLAYVCIHEDSPMDRVKEIIHQARPKIIITTSSNAPKVRSSFECPVITAAEIAEGDYLADDRSQPVTASSGTDLAYTVFTSGSTGVPKGVLITRDNLMSNVEYLASIYPYDKKSCLLQSCSLAFDVSVFEIFWTWHCGITLCSASNDVLFRDIEGFIAAASVTHLSMTPSVAALVNPESVPQVEFLVCSGEPMSPKVFSAWQDRGLHQGYGPSETTNICNIRSYSGPKAYTNNVGSPFPNTSLFICSKTVEAKNALTVQDFNLLSLGAVGEVWIGGEQVGRGYTDEELTSRSWLTHPKYGKLYRSGDIGRLLFDGSLVILGRDDDQVKIRGNRIELNEINSKLMQSQTVRDAFTLVLTDTSDRQKLVSFWAHKNGFDGTARVTAKLFDYLRDNLPQYMIPETLIPLDSLPLTQQGKVNKRALLDRHHSLSAEHLAQFSDEPSSNRTQEAMTTDESKVVNILSQLSGLDPSSISTRGSFFMYGVDSIRAISFAQMLRKLDVGSVDVSSIIRHSSVKRLLSHLEHQKKETVLDNVTGASDVVPQQIKDSVIRNFYADSSEVERILPCTSLQESMLASSESGANDSYVNHLTYLLILEGDIIKDAWEKVTARHEILRTVFASTGDPDWPYVQIVLRNITLPWDEHSSQQAGRLMPSTFESLPYSLHLEADEREGNKLHLYIHHALYDAEGIHNLHAEIEAISKKEPLSEPIQFSQYLDVIAKTDTNLAGQFWDRRLVDVVPSRLLESLSPEIANDPTTGSITHTCPVPYSRLVSNAADSSVSVLTMLQATLTQLFVINLDSTDICFGTIVNGRNTEYHNIAHTIGPCFNTVPTRSRLQQRTTVRDILRNLQSFNAEVLSFQNTPLRQLQKQYSPDGRALFDMLLLFQLPTRRLDPCVWKLLHESGQMDFPLILEAEPDLERNELRLTLHNSAFGISELNTALLTQFVDLLTHLIESNDSLVSRVKDTVSPLTQGIFKKRAGDFERGSRRSASSVAPHSNSVSQKSVLEQNVLAALAVLSKRSTTSISYDQNIYQLGLDSINAVQLAVRLKSYGYSVHMSEILESPKVCDIVKICQQASIRETHQPTSPFALETFDEKHRRTICDRLQLDNGDINAVWPCTATQIGILTEFIQSEGHLYYNKMRFHLKDDISLNSIRCAWKATVARHMILRTGFAELQNATSPFCMVVYSSTSDTIQKRATSGTSRSTQKPSKTDLSVPPWSLDLVEGEDGCFMDLSILHALYDAQSIHNMLQDTAAFIYKIGLPLTPPIEPALATIIEANQSSNLNPEFWQRMKNVVQPTKFPDLNIEYDVPSSFHVAFSTIGLPAQALQDMCAKLGYSLSVVCQTAWAELLAEYTGQTSVAFGVVFSGRTFQDELLNEVAFPCINTLPMVVELTSKTSTLIDQVSSKNTELHKSPHCSYTKIKQFLDLDDMMFDTIVVLQKHVHDNKLQQPWELVSNTAYSEHVISLEVIPEEEHLTLQLTYNQNRLPIKHSAILLDQYKNLLYKVLDTEADYIAPGHTTMAQLPPTLALIPTREQCLHDMVLQTAHREPKKTALEFVNEIRNDEVTKKSWTYEALIAKAAQVANLLLSKGVDTADLIATCFEKCPEGAFALLGILLSGCAYVAIDPEAPASRQSFILSDSKTKILLTSSSLKTGFTTVTDLLVLCIDDDKLMEQHSTTPPVLTSPPTRQDTCYCLYTSGTTGTPKGCLISHNSVVQAMLSFSRIFQGHWEADSRWLQFAAYHFDVSVLEHFWSWSEGICVVVIPRDLLFEDLSGTINKLSITHLDLTPSLARLLMPSSTPSLHKGVFIVGGEQVGQDIIETWGDSECLYNFYGPSEVTIGCTVHPRVRKNVKPTNIGRQWDNVGTYVLDPGSEKVVVVGGIGELCLSGPLVGKGYLNRPDLTAQKFVVLHTSGERIYRTGDLVRMLHDHSFEFLGRIDDQVKLRGQRLETSEIDHIILQSTKAFGDVATLVLKHPEQKKEQLVAFLAVNKARRFENQNVNFVRSHNLAPQIMQGRKALLERVPAYMVPTYFLTVSNLPLTINNKVDKKALKAFFESTSLSDLRAQSDSLTSEPGTLTSNYRQLLGLVASYFGIERPQIDQHTSLLQLGLDSISAINLSRTLKSAGFRNASIPLLMKYSTMMDLADKLCEDAQDAHQLSAADYEISKAKIASFAAKQKDFIIQKFSKSSSRVVDVFPCTPLQEGMISRLIASELDQPPYLTKFVYKLDTEINLSRLAKAWDRLNTELDILRTRFVSTEDGYAQVLLDETESCCKFDFSSDALSEDPFQMINIYFQQWTNSSRRLDLASTWEVWLTRGQEVQIKYMSLFMFHGIYDGISLPLILSALHKLYQNPDQDIHNGPQFHHVLPYVLLNTTSTAMTFWQQNLKHIKLLEPVRVLENHSWTAYSVQQELVVSDMRKHCQKLAVTPQAIFFAAWLYTLNNMFGINPTIGIVLSGRSIEVEDVNETIGPLFNTLPFAVNGLRQGTSLADLIKECYQKTVDILPFQHSALRDIRKCLQLSADSVLFDSLFVYQKLPNSCQSVQSPWNEVQSASTIDYTLNVEVEEIAVDNYKISIRALSPNVSYLSNLLDNFCDIIINISGAADVILPRSFNANDENSLDITQHMYQVSEQQVPENNVLLTQEAQTIRKLLADFADIKPSDIGFNQPTIFQLGLDSVDALKLVARLKTNDIVISVSDMLKYPTVSGMVERSSVSKKPKQPAAGVDTEHGTGKWLDAFANQGGDTSKIDMVLPATPMQSSLLTDFETYFKVLTYRVDASVNLSRLIQAIESTIKSTALLRTKFVMLEQSECGVALLQAVSEKGGCGSVPQRTHHLGSLERLSSRIKLLESGGSLDNTMPLIQVVTLDDEGAYFLIAMSHAYYDAWSLGLLLDRLERSYTDTDISESDVREIVEYENTLRQRIANPIMKDFWTKQLRSVSPTLFEPRSTTHKSGLRQKASKIMLKSVHETCRRHGITLQSLGLSVWSLSLMQMTSQQDVNFGIVLSGRTSEILERLIFPTFNTVIFRPKIDTAISKHDLLRQIHELSVDIYEFQDFPLSHTLQVARHSSSELFNTLFTFQKTPQREEHRRKILHEVKLNEQESSPPYAVALEMEETNSGLQWTVATQAGYLGLEGIEDTIELLDHILEFLVSSQNNSVFASCGKRTSICNLPALELQPCIRQGYSKNITHMESLNYDEEWSEKEDKIRQVLSQASGVQETEISKHTSLFQLGFDSISLIKVAKLLRQAGIHASVSAILKGQTIAKISQVVATCESGSTIPQHNPANQAARLKLFQLIEPQLQRARISSSRVEYVLPATGGQTYMLDMWRASQGNLSYATFWFEVINCSGKTFESAFAKLVAETPALRTKFVEQDNFYIQAIMKPDSEYQAPLQYQLVEKDGKVLVAIHLHHALYDAVSLKIITQELQRLCSNKMRKGKIVTDPWPFVDATNPASKSHDVRSFWTKYLGSHDLGIVTTKGSLASRRSALFIPDLMWSVPIETFARQQDITLQACIFAVIARIRAESRDGNNGTETESRNAASSMVVGIYLANRSLDVEGIEELVCPTFNIIPLRVNVSKSVSVIEAARQIHQDLQEIGQAEYCGVNMREIYEWTGLKLDCYVNFLRLPEIENQETQNKAAVGSSTEPVIRHLQGAAIEELKTFDSGNKPSPFIQADDSHAASPIWCTPALDVEARIDQSGQLAIGMFAPEDMHSAEDLRKMMDRMKHELCQIAPSG